MCLKPDLLTEVYGVNSGLPEEITYEDGQKSHLLIAVATPDSSRADVILSGRFRLMLAIHPLGVEFAAEHFAGLVRDCILRELVSGPHGPREGN